MKHKKMRQYPLITHICIMRTSRNLLIITLSLLVLPAMAQNSKKKIKIKQASQSQQVVEPAPASKDYGDANGIDPGLPDQSTATPRPDVFMYVEQMPEPGFDINRYLAENLKYPREAEKENIEGRVVTQFTVNEDGSIGDPKVMRGIGHGCDEEALRLIKGMPKWKPGKQNGKAVKVKYNLPITFRMS